MPMSRRPDLLIKPSNHQVYELAAYSRLVDCVPVFMACLDRVSYALRAERLTLISANATPHRVSLSLLRA
jgi:hypothetical protein